MERSLKSDKERVNLLIKGLIYSEIEILPKDNTFLKNQLNLVMAMHLLVNKITTARNTKFILTNSTKDVTLSIATGKNTTSEVLITLNPQIPQCYMEHK